ncbi:MAG TPA: ABC transporter substrate-binding protein [Methylomirabilota bacterium]|jgi:putative ABC transport system substrate-binding protein|nr:ABC transporter substrate-binding protein [Methylomirabilota bacterium]
MITRVLGAVVASFLAALCFGAAAEAQPGSRVTRIGWLSSGSPTTFAGRLAAFRDGLRELGHAEEAVFIEQRWADGREELLPALAAELVRLKVAVLVAVGTPATRAVQAATDTIPVVMIAVGDPVGTGLVKSLARPGGNVTGVSNLAADLSGKLLDLLREVAPGVPRVAVLLNPANPVHPVYRRETEVAAERVGIKVEPVEVRRAEELDESFAGMVRRQAGALIVLPDPLSLIHRSRIVDLANKHRLPAIYPVRDYAESGGLMSYGPYAPELYRRAASYVDKVLKGTRPGELPVEQPTRFELVLNARTARLLGLAFAPSLLLRADRVIE